MASTTSTTLTPGAQVTGYVKFFNADKGFGFVSVYTGGDYTDVFIRKEKGRQVTGTHDEPVVGGFFDYSAYLFRRDDTRIIMTVEHDGRGGWRARSWGVLPEFTWIDLYLNFPEKYIECYVGGRVELHNSSSFGTGGFTARIDSLELTREHLVLRARHYPMGSRYSTVEPADAKLGRAFEATYPLAGVRQDDRYGRLVLEWRTEESYDKLTLTTPSGR